MVTKLYLYLYKDILITTYSFGRFGTLTNCKNNNCYLCILHMTYHNYI